MGKKNRLAQRALKLAATGLPPSASPTSEHHAISKQSEKRSSTTTSPPSPKTPVMTIPRRILLAPASPRIVDETTSDIASTPSKVSQQVPSAGTTATSATTATPSPSSTSIVASPTSRASYAQATKPAVASKKATTARVNQPLMTIPRRILLAPASPRTADGHHGTTSDIVSMPSKVSQQVPSAGTTGTSGTASTPSKVARLDSTWNQAPAGGTTSATTSVQPPSSTSVGFLRTSRVSYSQAPASKKSVAAGVKPPVMTAPRRILHAPAHSTRPLDGITRDTASAPAKVSHLAPIMKKAGTAGTASVLTPSRGGRVGSTPLKAATSGTTSVTTPTPSPSSTPVKSLRTSRVSYSEAARSTLPSKKAKSHPARSSQSFIPPTPPTTDDNAEAVTRVYVLSVLLHRMQYAGLHATPKVFGSSDSVRNTSSSQLAKRLNEIATLLSRGTAEEVARIIAVTASPLTIDGLSAKIIISNPSTPVTTPTISPSTSETKEVVNLPATSTPQPRKKDARVTPDLQYAIARKTPDTDQFSVVRNSAKRGVIENFDDTVVEGKEIYTEWSKDPIIFHPPSRYTFRQFTQTFFRVIKSAAQFDLPIHAAYFCMSQCAAKVKRRCDTIDNLYAKNASLRSWRPTKDETVKSSLVVVKPVDIQHILKRHWVAENQVPTEPGFVFDKSNAHRWLHGLLDTITELRTLVDALNSTHCEKNVVIATHLSIKLHSYLSMIPSSLWGIPSLGTALTRCFVSIPSPREEDLDPQVELAKTSIPWEGDGRSDACLPFFRSVDSITAWSTSAISLSQSQFARRPRRWKYSVLQLPHNPPQIQPLMIPAMIKGFVDRLKLGAHAPKAETDLLLAWNKSTGMQSVPGVCHCEAGIMASNINTETVPLEENPFVIGVAKKCCQFCWMLRRTMEKNGLYYDLPGAHGFFFPWYPPPLPTDILLDLEARALNRLSDMITSQRGIYPTYMSSPATSPTNDDTLRASPEPYVEYLSTS